MEEGQANFGINDRGEVVIGGTFFEGAEETQWFCPDCALNGDEVHLEYVSNLFACPSCGLQVADEEALAEAYLHTIFEAAYESRGETKNSGITATEVLNDLDRQAEILKRAVGGI